MFVPNFGTGSGSGNTIHVVDTEGDVSGERSRCTVDPDIRILFDRHQEKIRSGLSIVGLVHSHPGVNAVLPSTTDMKMWCGNAAIRSDQTYVGISSGAS